MTVRHHRSRSTEFQVEYQGLLHKHTYAINLRKIRIVFIFKTTISSRSNKSRLIYANNRSQVRQFPGYRLNDFLVRRYDSWIRSVRSKRQRTLRLVLTRPNEIWANVRRDITERVIFYKTITIKLLHGIR